MEGLGPGGRGLRGCGSGCGPMMREGAGEMEEMQYPSLGSLPPERVISDRLVEGLRGLLSLLCYGYLHVGRVGCGLDPGGSLFPSNRGLGRLRDSSVKRERERERGFHTYSGTSLSMRILLN